MKKSQIIILGIVLFFAFLLAYVPHYVNPYPVHIDEWHHISQAMKLKNGEYELGWKTMEFGFHFILMLISYVFDLVLIYKFLPAIWMIVSSLVLFFVSYKKSNNNFYIAIFSIIFFASIKSNVNLLGLWFFTPLTFAIPFIFLYIYFFTEGLETQNKNKILISILIMIFILPIHAVSFLFSIPLLLIYSLMHYKYLLKEWKFFSIFLIIPIIGLLFYSIILKLSLPKAFFDLLNQIQFKYGWGVMEINNSPFEIYSLIAYILVIIGIVSVFLYNKDYKKYLPYIIWPITLVISIAIFRVFHVSYLSPYQRNVYYLAISLPFLSAIGLYCSLKLIKSYLKNYFNSELIIKTILIIIALIVIYLTYMTYFNIPDSTLLYKLINENDYTALKYLKQYPKAVVLAPVSISSTIYPITGHDFVASIYFYKDYNKDEVEKFFSNKTSCSEKKAIIKEFNVSYVISRNITDCNMTLIYNSSSQNSSIYIYNITDSKIQQKL